MYKAVICDLITKCQAVKANPLGIDEIRSRIIPENAAVILNQAPDFLRWIRDDNQYSFFYYEAQQSGICAKPVEAAAMILELIILDAIDAD
jgi:hypothetical protein